MANLWPKSKFHFLHFWYSPFYSLCEKTWRMLKKLLSNFQKCYANFFKRSFWDIVIFVVFWRFFDHENHILRYILSWKLLRMCNLMVLIEYTQSYWIILIFGQVMGRNDPQNDNYPIYGHTFLTITQQFLGQSNAWKIMVLMLLRTTHILGRKMWVAATLTPSVCGLKTRPRSWPNGWTFWLNRYLKNCFEE